MYRPFCKRERLLRWAGLLLKGLFICLFTSTALVVLCSLFGFGQPAFQVYQLIWGVVWRLAVTLLAFIAIVSMLEGLR